jgi:trehalose 6-phosphate phosphatase
MMSRSKCAFATDSKSSAAGGAVTRNAYGLPRIAVETALFLDFDGTLADLCACPADVQIGRGIIDTVAALQRLQSGALAIVSGRTIDDLDRRLAPLRVNAAGMHGAEVRLGDGAIVWDRQIPPMASRQLTDVVTTLTPMIQLNPGLQLEHKPLALALHYRRSPELAALCWQAAQAAIRDVAGFEVRPGKMVVEILPASIDKGTAIRRFMASPPFKGRQPVFAGDDIADEAAIEAVQRMGGIGIRIVDDPSTPTRAMRVVSAAHIVRDWLTDASTSG